MERLTDKTENILVKCNKCNHFDNCYDSFYCNKINKAFERLKEWEDLEENGMLIKLPCKIGDQIFIVGSKCLADIISDEECDSFECEECPYDNEFVVFERKVEIWLLEKLILNDDDKWKLNKTVFLTREEAEKALEKKGEFMYYTIRGQKIEPIKETNSKSVWIRFLLGSGEITDRKWLENYKNKLHPDDDWTNVNLETYGEFIYAFDPNECHNLIDTAMKEKVLGYLD